MLAPCQVPYKNSTICYYRFGIGPRLAICFHGFGEEAAIFGFLATYAGDQYTFLSIDLPFHGKTEWNDGLSFSIDDLIQIVEKIVGDDQKKLTLLGFSLGGRIALCLYQAMPARVEKIVLLAPDGLKTNFWYWLATQTRWGNKFFAFTMKKPEWFFGFLKGLNKLKLVNASIFKFVNYYIGDASIRSLLYNRWTTLRKLKPTIKRIKNNIVENNTAIRLVYGKHDRIIRSSTGENFKRGIERQCTILVIHSGHQVLHEKHIKEILPALLH